MVKKDPLFISLDVFTAAPFLPFLWAKKNYKKGWFIWWDDSCQITNITEHTWTGFWKAQYVLWEYEITDQEEEKAEKKTRVTLELTDEQIEAIKNII